MILLTGASGFVGRQVLRSLVDRDQRVRMVLREGSAPVFHSDLRPDMVRLADVFEAGQEEWRRVLDGVDTVVHLAWYAEPGAYLESERNVACLSGTIELARACTAAGVRRFVGVGTCAEYDLEQGILRPDTPLKPQTLYAACKASAFHVVGQLLRTAEVEFAWCRLFYLFGEGEDSRRLVPYLHRQLGAGLPAELTSGNQIRDFLDVRAAGDMIARVALGDMQGPLNICSGLPITVRQLAERIADQYGRRDLLRFGARADNLFDPPCVVGVPAALAKP